MEATLKTIKKWPAMCDFCSKAKPTIVYNLPAGTPLWLDKASGMTTCSTGWIAACGDCRKEIDSGSDAAKLLAERFFELNKVILLTHPDNTRELVIAWRERLNRLLFKKITNLTSPRKYVPFEDPLEGKFVDLGD